jgi:ParB family transcriptional regulator, chromosome partitioning protein
MKTADVLNQKLAGRIGESIGANRGSVSLGNSPLTAVPSAAADARYQGCSRVKEALLIELDRIMPDPDQPRKEFSETELNELAESLKVRGQLQPCRVRWEAKADRWMLVVGERRYRAAALAGLPHLLCIEDRAEKDRAAILTDQVTENVVRQDLKPVEQAHAYQALMAARGWSLRQLAANLKVSPGGVAKTLALLDLPDAVQVLVEEGHLKPATAYQVAKDVPPPEQEEVARRIVDEGLTRDQAADVIQARKAGRATSAITRREVRLDNGTKVTVSGPDAVSPETVAAALRLAAKRVLAEAKAAAEDQPGQAA